MAVCLLLAGCADEGGQHGPEIMGCDGAALAVPEGGDASVQRYRLELTGPGRIAIAVALWEYPPELRAGDWTQVFDLQGVESMVLDEEDNGTWMRLEGTGPITVEGCLETVANVCCEESYLDGGRSISPLNASSGRHSSISPLDASNGRHMPYELTTGTAHATMEYSAGSSWCGGAGGSQGDLSPGRNDVPATFDFWCS